MKELQSKLERVHGLLDAFGVDALWLRHASSFAWATCGKSSYINTASSTGLATLLITRDRRIVLTTNIEEPRIAEEEGLLAAGWEIMANPWYGSRDVLGELTAGQKLASDLPHAGMVDVSGPMARLRANLLPEEVSRIRVLGRICGEAMNSAIRAVEPGMTEHEIAALLAFETERRGAQAIVNLIATDERIFRFRHPLPTGKRLNRYAMLVLCGRMQGLVCSVTRLVYFGPLPDELRMKQDALAAVDATFIASTQPHVKLGDILAEAQSAYALAGLPDEWRLHHQGGAAGYEPREYLALPGSQDEVHVGQAFAWNPSITGTKMEDTMLVGEEINEVLTEIPDWPTIPVDIGGQIYARPMILEVD